MSDFDVMIMGSGLGGSVTATIMARKGWRVLLIDAGSHPRFAIGEATTPDISFLMKIMSRKYDVPELYNLTAFHRLRDRVSSACGIKKSFSFLYHDENKEVNPKHSHQFPTLAPPMGPDCHFFRQDTDAYMVGVALEHGVEVRQRTQIENIDVNDDGVVLTSSTGEEFRGRYLIDGCGFRSPLAAKFGLRDEPTRLKTKSRALFTHMIGVPPFEELVDDAKEFGLHYRLSEGTLHHMFDGGWMWIIPFNNHEGSTNPLCSVGVLLDSDRYPKTDQPPAEEFAELIARFPSVARQLGNAKPARDWVSTGRLQYSSSDIVGDRYCLLAHAGGFVDPLYSTGLNLTMSMIDDLIPKLDAALQADKFERAEFASVNENYQERLEFCDRMVHNSFRAFGNFDLWDAWVRVWVVSNFVGSALNINLFMNYEKTGDRKWLFKTEGGPTSGVIGSRFRANAEMVEAAGEFMQNFADGHITASEAADGIRSLLAKLKYIPTYFNWHRKDVRSPPPLTIPYITKMYLWFAMFAPTEFRKDLMAVNFSGVVSYTLKNIREHRSRVKLRKPYLRDVFVARDKSRQKENAKH